MTIVYLPAAQRALHRHRNRANQIMEKIEAFAAGPSTQGAKNLKPLVGRPGVFRLRVGDYRVLFRREGGDLVVIDIGPRGTIYEE